MNPRTKNDTSTAARTARAEASVWVVRLHNEERSLDLEEGLRKWLASHPENARQFELITNVWDLAGQARAEGHPRLRSWRVGAPRLRWAAAALTLVIGAAYGLFQLWIANSYLTDRGEQRVVRLEDGTRVYMNSATRLQTNFTASSREVQLRSGEAYFEVAHNPVLPFVVSAEDTRVTALGTSFNVRREAERIAITLVEGKISVATHDDEFLLKPGERLTLVQRATPKLDAPRIDTLTAWRRGEVVLDNTPLTDAIAEMNRYDDRRLRIESDTLASIRVSGVYRTGDNRGFADAVAELYGLRVATQADDIVLQRHSDVAAE